MTPTPNVSVKTPELPKRYAIPLRVFYALLAPLWLLVVPLTKEMLDWWAKMIGGARFFIHVGIGPFIGTLELLRVLAVGISIFLLFSAVSREAPRQALFWITVVFTAVALVAYMPAFANGRGFINSAVFAYHLKRELSGVIALGVVTALALMPYAFPEKRV